MFPSELSEEPRIVGISDYVERPPRARRDAGIGLNIVRKLLLAEIQGTSTPRPEASQFQP
jgi:hypothetical protein